MNFDLKTAIAVREREDGLYEKDTFDLTTAWPVEESISASEDTRYHPLLTDEQRAQAVVELTYKNAGKKVPFMTKVDWMLTSPAAKMATSNILGVIATGGIIPFYNMAKGIANAASPNSDIGKMVFDSAYKGLAENEEVQNLGGAAAKAYPDAPWQITGAMGALAEVLMFMPGVVKGVGELLSKDKQFTIALNNARRSPKWGDYIATVSKKVNKPVEVVDEALYRKLWEIRGETNYFKILNHNLKNATGMDLLSQAGSIPISRAKVGQSVNFTDPRGLVKSGIIKEITGERAIINLEGKEVLATLSQLSLPPTPTEGKAIPTFKEADKLPKGGAVEMDFNNLQVANAKVIGHRLGISPESVYNWGQKHNINLQKDVVGKIKETELTEMILGNKPLSPTGQKPPVEPPKTEVSPGEFENPKKSRIEIIQEKIDTLKSAEEKSSMEKSMAKYALEEGQQIENFVKGDIRVYKDGQLAEELKEIPAKYLTKNENAMDAGEMLEAVNNANLGVQFSNLREMADYLKRWDIEKKDLQKMASQNIAQWTVKKETTLLGQRIKDLKLGFYEGAIKTKEQVKSAQEELINVLESSELEAKDKAKFIRAIKNVQTPEQLEKALPEITERIEGLRGAAERRALINEIKDKISQAKDSGVIAVDYAQAIEDTINGLELKGRKEATLTSLEKSKQFFESEVAAGRDVTIPSKLFEKLKILEKKQLADITTEELQGVLDSINRLEQLGRTKLKAREAVYQAKKDRIKSELIAEKGSIESAKLPKVPIGDSPNEWVKRAITLQNYAQKTGVGLTPIDGLADITGMRGMKKALDADYGKYLTYNDEVIKQWYELTKGFSQKEFERIGVVAASRQEGGIERLANSGISAEEINAIKLTPEEEKVYRFVVDTFDKEFPAVQQYMKEVYNADVGKQENYVSFLSDYEAMSDLEVYQKFGQTPEQIIARKTKTVEQGFTKERANVSNIKLETNIDKIFRRHMDDVAYMLTTGENIKMYFEIVNSPEMREKLGDTGTLAWLQWLDLMARKGGIDGAKRIAALDVIRKNIGAGVLSFRLSSALVQFSSFADTIATIGSEWATKGAVNISTSPEWRNFIIDNFPEVAKAIGDDIAFREFGERFMSNLTRIGTTPLRVLDGLMRSVAASGSYTKLCSEKGIAVDLKNPDEDLILEATRLMRNSQGSSFFKDQPLAITAGYGITDNRSVNKLILTFQSFMLNRWDNINRQIWRMGIKEKDYGKAISSVFWLLIFAGAVEEGIRRGSRKLLGLLAKDKRKEQNFISNSILNIIQSVPLLGQLVSSIVYSSNPFPVINALEDLLGGAGSVVKGKKKETKIKGAIRTVGALGSLFGVPGSSQAEQILRKTIPKEDNPSRGRGSRRRRR